MTAETRHAHPRTLRLRRPLAVRAFPGDPAGAGPAARWKPGRPAASARRSSTAWSRRCPAWPSTAARTASPAASSAACARTRAPGSGHVLEHVAIELQNVAGEDVTFGKTRSISDDRPGVYSVVYEYAQKEEGIAAGELALKLLDSLLPAGAAHRPRAPEDWDWDTARDDFIRYAQRRALGPVDRLAGARRRGTRHPVAAPEPAVAGAARPRQVPAAHPGHGHRAARRTSRSNWPATRRKPTRSSARSACRCRARNWSTTPAARCAPRASSAARGDQAVQRQPRPRHHHQPDHATTRCAPASTPRASIRAR